MKRVMGQGFLPRERVKPKKRRPKAAQVDESNAVQGAPPQAQRESEAHQPLLQQEHAHGFGEHTQQPQHHPLRSSHHSQRDPAEESYSLTHGIPVKTADGYPMGPRSVYRHTGYAFSQSDEGNQVEIMASRIPNLKSVKWAHGIGYVSQDDPLPILSNRRRVETGPAGQLSLNSASGKRGIGASPPEDDVSGDHSVSGMVSLETMSAAARSQRSHSHTHTPRAMEGRSVVGMSGRTQSPMGSPPR